VHRLRNSDLIIEENLSVKDAALATGINVHIVQNYVKTYNNDPQRLLPGTYHKLRGRSCSKLTDNYSKFLLDYIEKNPTAVLVS
jgi:transposase